MIVEAELDDRSGRAFLIWFLHRTGRGSNAWLPVREGQWVIASGRVHALRPRVELHNLLIEPTQAHPVGPSASVPPWPVYPLTEGITQSRLTRWIAWALNHHAPKEWISPSRLHTLGMPALPDALRTLHAPHRLEDVEGARRRIALEELVAFYRQAAKRRNAASALHAPVCPPQTLSLSNFMEKLPFPLTAGQREVIEILGKELAYPRPMRRLLYGDVGSGKTVVAAFGVLRCVRSGYHAVVMAPTRLLAEQHGQTLRRLLDPWDVDVVVITGERSAAQRRRLGERLASGPPAVIVGTQAILSWDDVLSRTGLVVIDEEHRFGVSQRQRVSAHGALHLLSMSATPIPRTLALVLYADLDVSYLTERPPGRTPVDTRWIHPSQRQELYAFVRREVARSRQAFVVFPRVDGDEDEGASAVAAARQLAEGELSGLRVGLVHGRQSPQEQEETMAAFARGDLDVLVATTVIEVGVDVPNASVMVVEEADRFGLAQLHQLRGRVGRGQAQGYCLLVADPTSDEAKARIDALRRNDDGMRIAEIDLSLRGTGQLGGLRQSGKWEFRVVDPHKDRDLFALAATLMREVRQERREADGVSSWYA